jgi:hypothetical protein
MTTTPGRLLQRTITHLLARRQSGHQQGQLK